MLVVVDIEVLSFIRGIEVGVHGGGVGGVCMKLAVSPPDLGDLRDNNDMNIVITHQSQRSQVHSIHHSPSICLSTTNLEQVG